MSSSRRRQANPHLGAYYGILTSAFVSLVISLAMFEQLGWPEMWVARAMILVPLALYLAISLGAVLGGSLVTEVVFNYPGMGNTLYQAILARDYPVIQGELLIMTAAMLTANFVVDLSYVLLDPRLKRA